MSLSPLSLCLVSFLVWLSLCSSALFSFWSKNIQKYPKISLSVCFSVPLLFSSLPCMLLSVSSWFSPSALCFSSSVLPLPLFLVCFSVSRLFLSAPLSLLSPSLPFFLFCLLSIGCFSALFRLCCLLGLWSFFCCLYVHDNPWTKITLLQKRLQRYYKKTRNANFIAIKIHFSRKKCIV